MKYPHPPIVDKIIKEWNDIAARKPVSTEVEHSLDIFEEHKETLKSLLKIANESYIMKDWIYKEFDSKNIPLDVSEYLKKMLNIVDVIARSVATWNNNLNSHLVLSLNALGEKMMAKCKYTKYGQSFDTDEDFEKYKIMQDVKYNNGLICLEYEIRGIWNCFTGAVDSLNNIIEIYRPEVKGESHSSVHSPPNYIN